MEARHTARYPEAWSGMSIYLDATSTNGEMVDFKEMHRSEPIQSVKLQVQGARGIDFLSSTPTVLHQVFRAWHR